MNTSRQAQWVYRFTDPAYVKFTPKEDFTDPPLPSKKGIISRIQNYFSPPRQHGSKDNSPTLRPRRQLSGGDSRPRLKFLRSLTPQEVLIGNEDQLDALTLSRVIGDFVDTDVLWSINVRKAILHVAVDSKLSQIVVLPYKEVIVYEYYPKNMTKQPTKLCSVSLTDDVRHIQIVKGGAFALCYPQFIQLWCLSDDKTSLRKTLEKRYSLPRDKKLKLFRVPNIFENTLTIFWQEKLKQTFGVWAIDVVFSETGVKMTNATKIKEVPWDSHQVVEFGRYSKDNFFMLEGGEINLIQHGYILDMAKANTTPQQGRLHFINANRLVHIVHQKVQLYESSMVPEEHPPRLQLHSLDSIEVPPIPYQVEYFDSVPLIDQQFAVFYELDDPMPRAKGEMKYVFCIARKMKIEDKIKSMLPESMSKVEIQQIEEKADMASKMGLERKDIYLRLWNRSGKESVEDYKLLLDTLDYDTIKVQIEKKLKKNSMSFRQVSLLEHGCLQLLGENVFSTNPTVSHVKNYMISHYLWQKLQFYKEHCIMFKQMGNKISEDNQGRLLINIQEYNHTKSLGLRVELLELMSQYCIQGKDKIATIKLMLRFFKFSIRVVYFDLLKELVTTLKKKFIKVLQAIPQILPLSPDDDNQGNLWSQMSEKEWEHSLFFDNLRTIDNSTQIEEVVKSVWYRRYWLSQHCFIPRTKKQIEESHRISGSERSFYLIIEWVFESIKPDSQEVLRETIDLIQDKYPRMPIHLYGKIHLYFNMHQYFRKCEKLMPPEDRIGTLSTFLPWQDPELFRAMFAHEKVKKGFILKEIQPIYMEQSTAQVFNEGLLHYLASELSQISDIKLLLNRMNNQKYEFHQANQGLYEVLVRGMQLKLKLGSQGDVPVDQVVIYIQNIPIQSGNCIAKDLAIMKEINEEREALSQAKLNMSLFRITMNSDEVVPRLVKHKIEQAQILNVESSGQFEQKSLSILSHVQGLFSKLYRKAKNDIIIFSFISQILVKSSQTKNIKELLSSEKLQGYRTDQKMLENVVLYVFKQHMLHNRSYSQSSSFLKELFTLLPSQNSCRIHLEAELLVSQAFSDSNIDVIYPLADGAAYLTRNTLQTLISRVSGQHLKVLDLESLHKHIKILSNPSSRITLVETYEMVVVQVIRNNLIRQCFDKIRAFMQMNQQGQANFVYPALLIAKIGPQLNEQNRSLLIDCASYLFTQPIALLDIIQKLMEVVATNSERKKLLHDTVEELKQKHANYQPHNPLLEPMMMNLVKTEEDKFKFRLVIHQEYQRLKTERHHFAEAYYHLTYLILCHQPYLLPKYLYLQGEDINIKHTRSLISHLSTRPHLCKVRTIELAKRVFSSVLEARMTHQPIQKTIMRVCGRTLDMAMDIQKAKPEGQFEKRLSDSVQKMKSKLKFIQVDLNRRKSRMLVESYQAKLQSLKEVLANPLSPHGTIEYTYPDSDDDHGQQARIHHHQTYVKKKRQFDPVFESYRFLNRKSDEIHEYFADEEHERQKVFFHDLKEKNNYIFKGLSIDRNMNEHLKAFDKDDEPLNDKIRNSIRRGRSLMEGQNSVISIEGSEAGSGKTICLEQRIKSQKAESESGGSQYIPSSSHLAPSKGGSRSGSSRRSKGPESAKPSEDSRKVQVIQLDCSQNMIKIPATIVLQERVLPLEVQVSQGTPLDLTSIAEWADHSEFDQLLKSLVISCFDRDDLSFMTALNFTKRIALQYSRLPLNLKYWQIYHKMSTLTAKFALSLPLKRMLMPQGLFLKGTTHEPLFEFVLPDVLTSLTQEQLAKTCKVVTLAFKKSQLQQQILLAYWMKLRVEMELWASTEQQAKMRAERMDSILDKVSVRLLKRKEQDIVENLVKQEPQLSHKIGQMLVASCLRRNDTASADYFRSRYVKQ